MVEVVEVDLDTDSNIEHARPILYRARKKMKINLDKHSGI